MKNTTKKITSILLVLTIILSCFAFVGCDEDGFFLIIGWKLPEGATETVALRGYQNGSLTPYYDDGGQAGNIYTRFSLELRYPIIMRESTMVWALVFAEAGNCWKDYRDYNPLDLKKSAGVGLRVYMPMFGLLGIDWAYGFDKVNGQVSGSQFHFVIGQEF